MDFYNDDELDYEEDLLENSEKDSEKGDTKKNASVSGSDDQYLRIDFSEGEENLTSDETFLETPSAENIVKANEQNERLCHRSNSSENEHKSPADTFSEGSNGDSISPTNKKLRKMKNSTQWRYKLETKRNPTKPFGVLDKNGSIRSDRMRRSKQFRIPKKRKDCEQAAFYDQRNNSGFGTGRAFNQFAVGNNQATNESCLLNANYGYLKEDEKMLMALKKEARLKRFMNNDTISLGTKSNESKFAEVTSDLQLGSSHPEKSEEWNLIKENVFIETEKNENSCGISGLLPKEKPKINKESLLKKKNPFDVADLVGATTRIIEETEPGKECSRGETTLNPATVHLIRKSDGNVTGPNLICRSSRTENDANSCVKFVRIITKSFDELMGRNWYSSQASNQHHRATF